MSVSDFIVRPATPGDTDALGRLGALLVQQHHNFDQRRFLPTTSQTVDRYGSFLASQLNEPDVVILVAEHEGRVIGYAFGALEGYDYLALRGPAAVLHDLLVDSGHRGRGVGRALLQAVVETFTAREAPRLVLSTAERNESAQRFFEQMGFRRTMVEMTKELD